MFLSADIVGKALAEIEHVHIFYGTTFLTFKRGKLPVGHMTEFVINSELRKFMEEHYKPYRYSKWYYRAFRHVQKDNHWLSSKWPSGSAQSTMTRDFGDAFLHESSTRRWGWAEDYIDVLLRKAPKAGLMPVPMFYLAVWLYRDRDWPSDSTADTLVRFFISDFRVGQDDLRLFDRNIPTDLNSRSIFQSTPMTTAALTSLIGPAPDAPQEAGGTLAHLELQGIGPSPRLVFDPASRLSLIIGDNGLGKTFLLECAWWALTGRWAGLPAFPRQDTHSREARISFRIAGESASNDSITSRYDLNSQAWPAPRKRPTLPGLILYARVDGSFAVFDPIQNYVISSTEGAETRLPQGIVLDRDQVWNGYEVGTGSQARTIINGLIRDLIQWQSNPERFPLKMFEQVLEHLSPSETSPLRLGVPTRLPGDRREIPTLLLPYGAVPVVHAAAGMRRILAIAYLIVWSWDEHVKSAELARREPQRRLVILVDEIEAHLHPKWQRLILPALLEIQGNINTSLQVQYLITTHSPLVTASLEPVFNQDTDALYHLDLVAKNLFDHEVSLSEVDFTRRGTVDSWLTAENAFGLNMARSVEAEHAINQAKELQLQGSEALQSDVRRTSDLLMGLLSEDDEFWPRWVYFAEQHGVEL